MLALNISVIGGLVMLLFVSAMVGFFVKWRGDRMVDKEIKRRIGERFKKPLKSFDESDCY
jgi:hypothetical protein